MSEVYYDIRKQGKAQDNQGKHLYFILPLDFYGKDDQDYTAYHVWTANDSGFIMSVTAGIQVDMNDWLEGGNHSDQLYGGDGNDLLEGHDKNDQLIGGRGSDTAYGGNDFDIILGDWSDYPDVFYNGTKITAFDIPAESDQVTGDDRLYGGDGSDIIIGGPGNDQIDGGPRGGGFLDDVTGGSGADLFLLSYNDPGQQEQGSSFWDIWGESTAVDVAGGFSENVIEQLERKAAKQILQAGFDEFENSSTGAMLMGPLGSVGFSLGESLVESLLQKSPVAKPPKPQDTLVIRDFDPREDVLVLPLPLTATSVGGQAHYFGASAAEQNVGKYPELNLAPRTNTWGLQWTHGGDNTEFAQVFFADEYLEAMGIDPSDKNSATVEGFYNNILTTGVIWDSVSGMQNANKNYAFSASQDDVVVNYKAPSGSQTLIFGALSGWVVTATGLDGERLGGTNFGDIISASKVIIPADEVLNNQGILDTNVFVYGFGGDDEIYGNNGSDSLYGGDGDDRLYGFATPADNQNGNRYNRLYGGDGDDTLFAGAGTSAMDGGDGERDAVSYQLSPRGVTVDLSTAPTIDSAPDIPSSRNFPGLASDFPGVAFTGYATGYSVYDILSGIEDIVGSDYDDTLIGDAGDNIIDPGFGNDAIYGGGGGTDYVSYQSLDLDPNDDGTYKTGVTVDFHERIFRKVAADGTEYNDTGLSGFVGVIGSRGNDILLGANTHDTFFGYSAGNDSIDGRAHKNTLSYKEALGAVTIDVAKGTTQKTVFNGYVTDATGNQTPADSSPDGVDSFANIDVFRGSQFDDTIIGGQFAPDDTASLDAKIASPDPVRLRGGGGDDTLVYQGSIGDIRISTNLQRIRSDSFDAKLKNIETWEFDEYSVLVRRFDKAATNLDGKGVVIGHQRKNDLLVGHANAADELVGRRGSDALLGLGGDDALRGGRGRDEVLGFSGNDVLRGGRGNDTLVGFAGDDWLKGGAGRNTLDGGKGDDVFVFSGFLRKHDGSKSKADKVIGYEAGEKIVLKLPTYASSIRDDVLDKSSFHEGSKATAPHHRIIIDADKGLLIFDANGSRKGGAVVVAKFLEGDVPQLDNLLIT